MTHQLLSLGLRVAGRRCTVIGHGSDALCHARALRDAGAQVTLQSERFLPTHRRTNRDNLRLIEARYTGFDPCAMPFLVIAVTHQPELDARVVREARALGALVWCVDDPADSDFVLVAEARHQPAALSSPWEELPQSSRRGITATTAQALPAEATRSGRARLVGQRERSGLRTLPSPRPANSPLSLVASRGHVSLVGAGPGAADLLTVRGIERLAAADVVIHDELIPHQVLRRYAPSAQHVNVGKRKGRPSVPQSEINRLLVDFARRGLSVVRLKGGDPCLFGRAEEERHAVAEAGLPCELVPGISALSAVPAAAGIIVTNRDCARSLGAFSLHKRAGELPSDAEWKRMAEGPDTLVLFMGRTVLSLACQRLVAFGRSEDTPAVLIIDGTRTEQKVIRGTLRTLPEHARLETTDGPGLIVVGEACRQAQEDAASPTPDHQSCEVASLAPEPLLSLAEARPRAALP